MFHTPDYYHNISMRLSEVLDDIGVNENMVLRRRKTALLGETIHIISQRAIGKQGTVYKLGSMSEGTTTIGLQADTDTLICTENIIVIQDRCEWTPGKINLMMIQNETTPPGYCLLQVLRLGAPLPAKHEMGNVFVKDTNGRTLCTNTIIDTMVPVGCQRQGPSLTQEAQSGSYSRDIVPAYLCQAWPQSSRAWLVQQETNTWPTPEMKRYVKTTKCFVVGVGSKASENADFEWRLSTSLAERCLMFNLNITQIRCYILMKMILKTYINLDNESYISSYMCKTVLFHCIASKPSYVWKECNILNCLNLCLFTLNRCVLNGNCPHFIVHENNLMTGKLSAEVKHKILERMSNLIPCDGISLFGIQIDDLGERFQLKLNIINELHHNMDSPDEYSMNTTALLLYRVAGDVMHTHNNIIDRTKDEHLEVKLKNLIQIVKYLTIYYRNGDKFEKTTCRLLAPLFCTSIGSLIASHNIQSEDRVSPQALAWLDAGQDSDVASSKLKLASVLYCTGNMERAIFILNDVEEQYEIEVTEPVCVCYNIYESVINRGFGLFSSQNDEEALKCIVALCVKFSPSEIHCVTHELQFEMFRSTQEDLLHRGSCDHWMDCAVVDSHPYLYFLQYKTYGSLQRPEEQRHALTKLMSVIEIEPNLAHRETALNLLGQCMEQENRPVDALQCYGLSLRQRGEKCCQTPYLHLSGQSNLINTGKLFF